MAPTTAARHRPAPTPPSALPSPVPGIPTALRLPTLGINATVRQVVTTNSVLGVPDDPAELGWWTGSALPGAREGSIVIDGHVDSARSGPGALFHLADLTAGDPVSITTDHDSTITYHVTERHIYPKTGGLPAQLFTRTGAPRLVLITCAGPFDHTQRSYQDNIAVFAIPIR